MLQNKPITVLAGCDGRHVFDTIQDRRIRVVTSLHDAADPDLIVFPCGTDRRFEKALATPTTEGLRRRLSDGSTGVVFDTSTEGVPHKPDITASLHCVLHALGASPLNCVYITQERNYDSDYRAHCAAIGLEPQVAVLNHDYWISYALKQFANNGAEVYEERLAAFRARGPRRERRFVSLNKTPRPTKTLFLLSLLRDDLWNQAFVSFGGFGQPGGPGKPRPTTGDLARALPAFEDKVTELAPWLDVLDGYGRVLFGQERHGWKRLDLANGTHADDLGEYEQTWFSVITETEMRARPSRITEKAIKPLVNFHPLIVLGNPGSLKMVRSYGFVTFEDYFDESYDDELDPRRRFDLVYQQVVRLCRMDEAELARRESALADKLVFNAQWGMLHFAGICSAERDRALVDDIVPRSAGRWKGQGLS